MLIKLKIEDPSSLVFLAAFYKHNAVGTILFQLCSRRLRKFPRMNSLRSNVAKPLAVVFRANHQSLISRLRLLHVAAEGLRDQASERPDQDELPQDAEGGRQRPGLPGVYRFLSSDNCIPSTLGSLRSETATSKNEHRHGTLAALSTPGRKSPGTYRLYPHSTSKSADRSTS